MPKRHSQKEQVVATAVLCDEIRKEDNGKLLLIGVYSGELLVDEVPVTLALSAYVNFFMPAGKSVITMRFQSDHEISPEVEIIGEGPTPVEVGIPTPKIAVTCKDEGSIRFEVQFNKDGNWLEVVSKRVLRRETFNREIAQLRAH